MATNPSYADPLKDPRWQRKRLEVLQREGWKCEGCGDHTSTLHVHHRQYLKSRNPWDYPDDLLQVLCETCHSRISERRAALQSLIGQLDSKNLDRVIGYAKGLIAWRNPNWLVEIDSPEQADGIEAAFDLPWDALVDVEELDEDLTGHIRSQRLIDIFYAVSEHPVAWLARKKQTGS